MSLSQLISVGENRRQIAENEMWDSRYNEGSNIDYSFKNLGCEGKEGR